jgi:hypothetical protein
MPVSGCAGEAEGLRDLFDGQPGMEAQLYHLSRGSILSG